MNYIIFLAELIDLALFLKEEKNGGGEKLGKTHCSKNGKKYNNVQMIAWITVHSPCFFWYAHGLLNPKEKEYSKSIILFWAKDS